MLHGIRWVACLGLLVAGCSNTSDTGTYSAPLCASDGSCTDSARCVRGICHDACTADADCPAGAVCLDGVCWASASGSCASDSDCAAGEACTAGACTAPPAPIACAGDADCPPGATCDGGSCVSRPVAAEICGNGIDDDLDGLIDEGCSACSADSDCAAGERCVRGTCGGGTGTDADGDGYPSTSDCNDADASVYPGATEACNGVDDNCDGVVDEGCSTTVCASDSDCSAGEMCVRGTCGAATGACASDSDCGPGDVCRDGRCGGAPDADRDGDGYPSTRDCDDADASVNPGAAETCNGIDDNCDGVVDEGCSGGMTTCRSDTDCSPGQLCLRGYCSNAP